MENKIIRVVGNEHTYTALKTNREIPAGTIVGIISQPNKPILVTFTDEEDNLIVTKVGILPVGSIIGTVLTSETWEPYFYIPGDYVPPGIEKMREIRMAQYEKDLFELTKKHRGNFEYENKPVKVVEHNSAITVHWNDRTMIYLKPKPYEQMMLRNPSYYGFCWT